MLLFCFAVTAAEANAGITEWKSESDYQGWFYYKSSGFTFYFEKKDQNSISELLAIIEKHSETLSSIFQNHLPKNHIVHVVINGRAQYPNGYYMPIPPAMVLHTASLGIRSKDSSWFEFLFLHEFSHYLHLYYPKGLAAFLSAIFGPAAKGLNGAFTPLWFIEGLAVSIESRFSQAGRLQDPFFTLPTRADVLLGTLPNYTDSRLVRSFEFQFGQVYQYGSFFFEYISEQYGFDTIMKLWNEYLDAPFLFETKAGEFLGKSLNTLHAEMEQSLYERFSSESGTLPRGVRINTNTGRDELLSLVAATEQGIVYYKHGSNSERGFVLLSYDMQEEEPLLSISAEGNYYGTGLADITPDGSSLVFIGKTYNTSASTTLSILQYNNYISYFSDIYLYIPHSRELRKITNKQNLFMPSISNDARFLVASQRRGSVSRLIKIKLENPEMGYELLYEPTGGEILEKDISPNAAAVVFIEKSKKHGNSIQLLDLNTGQQKTLLSSDWLHFYDLRFLSDDIIQFSSDLEMPGKLLQLYTLNVQTRQLIRVAQDRVGVASALRSKEGSLVYLSNSGNGFAFYRYEKEELLSSQIDPASIKELRSEHSAEFTVQEKENQEPLPVSRFISFLPLRFAYWLPTFSMRITSEYGAFFPGLEAQFFSANYLSNLNIKINHYFDTQQETLQYQPMYKISYSYSWWPVGDFIFQSSRSLQYYSELQLYSSDFQQQLNYGRMLWSDVRNNTLRLNLHTAIFSSILVSRELLLQDSFNMAKAATIQEYAAQLLYTGQSEWYSRRNPLFWELSGSIYYHPPYWALQSQGLLFMLKSGLRTPISPYFAVKISNKSTLSWNGKFGNRLVLNRLGRLSNLYRLFENGSGLLELYDHRFSNSFFKSIYSLDLLFPFGYTDTLGNTLIQPYAFYINLFTDHSFAVDSEGTFTLSSHFDTGIEGGTVISLGGLSFKFTLGSLFRVPYSFTGKIEYSVYFLLGTSADQLPFW